MRIAINGFGRIGRSFLRLALQQNLNIVAINDLGNVEVLAHLFKYDSVHGGFTGNLKWNESAIEIQGKEIQIFHEKEPSQLPWGKLGIDVVIEATGKFISRKQASLHLAAGAKQVIISAPSSDIEIPTVVLGVNDHVVDFKEQILSNASCTTNNVAPLVKVLDENWGVENGYITTVHSMTGDQNLHDAPHKDLRRARAASSSIIPTSTGAAKAITRIFPHLDGKLGGAGIRVPVLNGSLTDFTCILKKEATVNEINEAFRKVSMDNMHQILQYTEDPIVSIDIINNPYSCVFDAQLTSVVGGLTKVVGWYDNEYGYSSRLIDLLNKIKEKN